MTPEVAQLPGCLPEGYGLDSMLTVEQFSIWTQKSIRTITRKLPVTPGVFAQGQKNVRIHPRTFLDKGVNRK